ncbi:MAG: 16S rRNA (adenine(1518)-N(6)/adenine(1519)-N(6))-dimethyltransferase RsmA [Candidatus Altiarchaeota archaeon]|nr:16S rRNA (adenine(1518)-N(6)/adenine(1519)-N(6))-dimethyltransferase RsmA [Candidatus Altiarchaeota archaeon]
MDAKKDQRLMVDNLVIEDIVRHANLSGSETVLEVGAGNGHLTVELAEHAGNVIAVEKDRELCKTLRERVKRCGNVTVLEGDALKLKLPACDKIVSNLPYSVSRRITVRLLEHGFREAFLLYQREFAQKLAAKPGGENYRFVTALVQSTCAVTLLMDVPASAFRPQPRVSSTLVMLAQRIRPCNEYVAFLQELFNHKNKNVSNILGKLQGGISASWLSKKPVDMKPEELAGLFALVSGKSIDGKGG